MRLDRKELINYENQWINNHPNKNDNPQEYVSFLNGINDIISKYDYEIDDRFVTYGRRDFLRKEFSDYLNERTYSGRGKFNDAFVDLAEYYTGNTWISFSSIPDGVDFHKIDNANVEYIKDGIICKQEIDIIKEMIKEFKSHLELLNVNKGGIKKKNIILMVRNCNWGEIGPNMWSERKWLIYDDLSVDFFEMYNSTNNDNTKKTDYKLEQNKYDFILRNIQNAKENDEKIDADDGEAWEFIEYNNNSELWKRDLGYIYGITSLENIAALLRNEMNN